MDDYEADADALRRIEEEARRKIEEEFSLDDETLEEIQSIARMEAANLGIDLDPEVLKEIEREAMESVKASMSEFDIDLDDLDATPDSATFDLPDIDSDFVHDTPVAEEESIEDFLKSVAIESEEAAQATESAPPTAVPAPTLAPAPAAAPEPEAIESVEEVAPAEEPTKPSAKQTGKTDKVKSPRPARSRGRTSKAESSVIHKARLAAMMKAKELTSRKIQELSDPDQGVGKKKLTDTQTIGLVIGGCFLGILVLAIIVSLITNRGDDAKPSDSSTTNGAVEGGDQKTSTSGQAAFKQLVLEMDRSILKDQGPDNFQKWLDKLEEHKSKYPDHATDCDDQIERLEGIRKRLYLD